MSELAKLLKLAKDRARDEAACMKASYPQLTRAERLRLARIRRFIGSPLTGRTLRTAQALSFVTDAEAFACHTDIES
jgi:hypothetical protein